MSYDRDAAAFVQAYAPREDELRARVAHAREGMLALDASLPPSARL